MTVPEWISLVLSIASVGVASWSARSASRASEEGRKTRLAAENQAAAAAEQVEAARRANELLELQLEQVNQERRERTNQRIRLIPGGQNRGELYIQNDGPHDLKINEMRITGPGELQIVELDDDQWISPITFGGATFIPAGERHLLFQNALIEDQPFLVTAKIVLNGERWTLRFGGTLSWDALRTTQPMLTEGWLDRPLQLSDYR